MLLKDFSHGYRTNNITPQSLQAGYNIELVNTSNGRSIYRCNGNTLITAVANEKIIGGFDYVKGDTHYELIFTNDGTKSKAYLFFNETLTLIKDNMSVNAKHFNAVNFINGAFITNGIDAPFFYEYGATPAIKDVNCVSQSGERIRGLALQVFDNRIFMGSGSGLYSCGLGDPTDWASADVETTRAGYIKNFMNSSATIVAIENYNSKLIIHRTSDTVWLAGTSGSYTMDVVSNVGCASPFAVANLDVYQIYFLKHINGVGLFYLSKNALGTVETKDEISTYIHEEFANIDNSRLDEIYVIPNTKKNEIWIYIPRTDYPNKSYWLIYNLTSKCFYPPRITQPIAAAWLMNGLIHIGTKSGEILREDNGDTFNGSAISFKAETSTMDFGTLVKKEFDEQCRYIVDGEKQNNFNVSFIRNDDESTIITREIATAESGCLVWADEHSPDEEIYKWGQNFARNIPMTSKCGKSSSFYTLKVRFWGDSGDLGLLSFEIPKAEEA